MAHHFSRDITPLPYTFTENTDISLDSNRHMMLHELRKLMQEIRNMKVDLHNNEEKFKRLKTENDAHLQKLLEEIKEIKLYINVLETEKQKTKTENNELRTQVTALREKQEKEINELRLIEEKYKTLKVENDEMKLFINELKTEKERTNAGLNEMRTQVTNLSEKQDKEIIESRTIISGQETKISELQTKYCQLNTQIMIIKENVPNIINGLYEQMVEDIKSHWSRTDWSRSVKLMKRYLDNSTPAYEQLNNITEYYNIPLTAAIEGYIELIEVMLDNGLPINQGYKKNLTMLHEAAECGHYSIVKFLIQRGADVNVRDWSGDTPLHYATTVNIVQLLLDNGADINATNEYEKTPLHEATIHGYVDIVQLLVESGADINAKDNIGNTPLHDAALNGHKSVVQSLVNKGCDTTITDKEGKTAADVARTPEIRAIIRNK